MIGSIGKARIAVTALVVLLCGMTLGGSAECPKVGAICQDGSSSPTPDDEACSDHQGVAYWVYSSDCLHEVDVQTPSIEMAPTVRIESDTSLSLAKPFLLLDATASRGSPPYTFRWSPNGEADEDITVTAAGTYTLIVTGADGLSGSGSVTIIDTRAAPTVSAGAEKMLTCSTPSVLLDAEVLGGTPPYAYLWSPGGQTTEDITADAPGTYTIAVADAEGRRACNSVVVSDGRTPPSLDAGPNQALTSAASSVVLHSTVREGIPPYGYSWTPDGQTTEDIAVSAPGTYTLTVVGANGCSAEDTVTVLDERPPFEISVEIHPAPATDAGSVVLDATISGGTPPYTYLWSPEGQETEDITVVGPGSHTLAVTGVDGRAASVNVVVSKEDMPFSASIGPVGSLSCSVTSVVLRATAAWGTPPYAYLWSPGGETTEEITVTVPGEYGVTVVGADGQEASRLVTVDENRAAPVVDAGPDGTLSAPLESVLLDATVSGGTPPYTYLWSPGGETTEDISAAAPGAYTLTVTGANGCSASDTVTVTAVEVPLAVDAGPDRALTCSDPTSVLDARVSGGALPYAYVWSPGGQTAEDITVTAPGTYTLTVTAAGGRQASDSVVVSENKIPPRVDAGSDQPLKSSAASVVLDATVTEGTPPYTYSWAPTGERTEDITVSSPGTYTLTATGANGCSASDAVVITESAPRRWPFYLLGACVAGGAAAAVAIWRKRRGRG